VARLQPPGSFGMSTPQGTHLFDGLMVDPHVDAILGNTGYVRRMLDFEAALARAQAQAGVIPHAAADAIAFGAAVSEQALNEFTAHVAVGTEKAGTPVIPLVKLLTARTAEEGQAFVHWGATTQDVMDTALVLQLRDIAALFDEGLQSLAAALAVLARTHRDTPMIARTVLQHALPTTFGAKTAGWLAAVLRHQGRLAELKPRVLALQFGGAAGTLASLGGKGREVAAILADELRLALPVLPWHSARDRIGEMAAFCGLLCGTLGKIGRDVALMMQTDVQEAFEPAAPGRGGSSTMPHKRNPVFAAVMTSAGLSAPGLVATILSAQMHEHERAAGHAHAEWRALPELLRITSGALRAAVTLAQGLEVQPERMRRNIEATGGLVMAEAVMMALAGRIGRLEAHHLVEDACKRAIADGEHLREVLASDPRIGLGADELAHLFEPGAYLGDAQAFVDATLKAHADLPEALLAYRRITQQVLG
jgi:3-carboxy-cis,cis-muconate cycloisomerase